MKYGFLGLGLILFGIFGLVFIVAFESVTINNESEYFTLKEALQASMYESIDLACFRNSETDGCNGGVKISEQKVVENFTRRFAASIMGDATNYEIQFYDIIEKPPKVTVIVKGTTEEYTLSNKNVASFDLVNNLTGIIEAKDWEIEKDK